MKITVIGIAMLLLFIGCKNKVFLDFKNKTDTIQIVSPVLGEKKADMSKLPSYAFPRLYSIVKFGDVYRIQLPGGTIDTYNDYNSIGEAQEKINNMAKTSYDNFINSGGTDY